MDLFIRFATEGLYFPAVMIAFGSLIILRAPSESPLPPDQFASAPPWLRWIISENPERRQRRGGWIIVAAAAFTAIMRLATSTS